MHLCDVSYSGSCSVRRTCTVFACTVSTGLFPRRVVRHYHHHPQISSARIRIVSLLFVSRVVDGQLRELCIKVYLGKQVI